MSAIATSSAAERIWSWGVDGCRGGWFAVTIASAAEWQLACRDSLRDLETALPAAKLKLVDIPIGLPEHTARRCDREGRKLLGPSRASSIFPVPCREAVNAADYPTACTLNAKALGVRLSRQSWNIVPKIREVDAYLRQQGISEWRESHPELAFRALNRNQSMHFRKKTTEGKAERLALLSGYFSAAKSLFESARRQYRRSQVADDDIIDALVLAVTAWLSHGPLSSVPTEPETDASGLPMEIVFFRSSAGEKLHQATPNA